MSSNNTKDTQCWYVIHTHPRQEDRAESNLRAWRVETFNPKIKGRRYNQYTGKAIYLCKPLFPRYIFARFMTSRLLHKIWFTRGVESVVSFGGTATSVDDEIINLIKSKIGDDGFVKIGEEFKAGDEVVINNGPFKDLKGILEREVKETERVMILLTTINYQSHISIEKKLVEKAAGCVTAFDY